MIPTTKTLVIITGGTIEALYSPEKGTPFMVPLPGSVEGSAIPEAVGQLGFSMRCQILKHSMKDSKNTCAEEIYGLFKEIERLAATERVYLWDGRNARYRPISRRF